MKNLKENVVNKMVLSLKEKAYNDDIDLKVLDYTDASAMLNSIDDEFLDGGETRCENFTDVAWEYSQTKGELGDSNFQNAQWECIELAYQKLKEEFTTPLKSETNTPEVEDEIINAAKIFFNSDDIVTIFQDPQWYVKVNGQTYSVCDAEGGDSIDGFDFEEL